MTRHGSYRPLAIGARYARLVVLGDGEPRGANRMSTSLVRCDCGIEKTVVNAEVRRGRIKSCGCMRAALLGAYSTLRRGVEASTERKARRMPRVRRGEALPPKLDRLAAIREIARLRGAA